MDSTTEESQRLWVGQGWAGRWCDQNGTKAPNTKGQSPHLPFLAVVSQPTPSCTQLRIPVSWHSIPDGCLLYDWGSSEFFVHTHSYQDGIIHTAKALNGTPQAPQGESPHSKPPSPPSHTSAGIGHDWGSAMGQNSSRNPRIYTAMVIEDLGAS